MNNKTNIINQIEDTGIVVVIRGNSIEEAVKTASASIRGGINILEITYTNPKAEEVISILREKYENEGVVGAGTVLDAETARSAILKGAQFIVGPNFNKNVAKLCNRYRIPYIAGCMTINEIVEAMEYGTDIIKLFPGSAYGPSIIKDIKGPLPQVEIMPTGGVNIDNVSEWIKNGCVAIGIGSALTAPSKEENYELITELAKRYVEKVRGSRLGDGNYK